MRASNPLPFSTFLVLLLAASIAAWPLNWPRWLPELDSLVARADSSSSAVSNTAAAKTAAATETAAATSGTAAASSETAAASTAQATDTDSASKTGTITSKATTTGSSKATSTGSESGSKSGSSSGSGSKKSTKTGSTSYDARLPAGGISMQTPAVISGSQYYKIGDYVTFGWNYTSLSATPTAINILASCSANSQLYTIAMNQTVETTGAVTWDTNGYQATAVQNPLLTETYTLIIYDAASSISATAQAGYLAVYDTYTFGMYTPQPYVPLSEFSCATCSGALSDMERRALGMVFGMCLVTVLSFTWFVSGTGIIW